MRSVRAFTLVETLVVVALMALLSTLGLSNYSRLQDRQRVENAAKDIITQLRAAQSSARSGDFGRGAGADNCGSVSVEEVASRRARLLRWQALFDEDNHRVRTQAVCQFFELSGFAGNNSVGTSDSREVVYDTKGILQLYCAAGRACSEGDADNLVFDTITGETYSDDGSGHQVKTRIWVMADSKNGYYYRFSLNNGNITNGCFCDSLDASGDCWSGNHC